MVLLAGFALVVAPGRRATAAAGLLWVLFFPATALVLPGGPREGDAVDEVPTAAGTPSRA